MVFWAMVGLLQLFFAGVIVYGVIALHRVRNNPDWKPRELEKLTIYGELDRWRYEMNAGCAIVGGTVALIASLVIPMLIELARARPN